MDMISVLPTYLPELTLAIGSIGVLVGGAFAGRHALSLVSGIGVLVLVSAAVLQGVAPHAVAFQGAFVSDAAASFAKVAIYLASAVAIFLGERWLSRSGDARFEYPVLILLAALGMGVMVSAGDLIALYMGIELQSLALYVLCAFRRDDAKASEAGLKYFVLGALSSGLLLYGASLIYGFAGSTRFVDIALAAQMGAGHAGVIFGLIFLVCGIAFKVSAAPFHMWTPDVYEGAPTPVTAFLAAAPKLAAMVLFARLLTTSFPNSIGDWRQIIAVISVISVTVGALGGLVQSNLKRLLAYSSIANIGYALLGLAAGSQDGIKGMLIFLALYVVDITGFFACLLALSRQGKPMETLSSLAGLTRTRPGLAFAITIFSMSALGIPFLSGFWGKFFVFQAAVTTPSLVWPAVYGLVMSVVGAFYYLRVVKTMWFDESAGETDAPPADARLIAFGAAAFAFPLVNVGLHWLELFAGTAAKAFGLA